MALAHLPALTVSQTAWATCLESLRWRNALSLATTCGEARNAGAPLRVRPV